MPEQVQTVIDQTFLSKFDSKQGLDQMNEDYFAKHKSSAPHVHSVVRLRHILEQRMDNTNNTSVKDLVETLKLDHITMKQAIEGLEVLKEINAGSEGEEAYKKEARDRWPRATAFKQ